MIENRVSVMCAAFVVGMSLMTTTALSQPNTGEAVSVSTDALCPLETFYFAGDCRSLEWVILNLALEDAEIKTVTGVDFQAEDGATSHLVLLEQTGDNSMVATTISDEVAMAEEADARSGYKVITRDFMEISETSEGYTRHEIRSFTREGTSLAMTGWKVNVYYPDGTWLTCDDEGSCGVVQPEDAEGDISGLSECQRQLRLVRSGAKLQCLNNMTNYQWAAVVSGTVATGALLIGTRGAWVLMRGGAQMAAAQASARTVMGSLVVALIGVGSSQSTTFIQAMSGSEVARLAVCDETANIAELEGLETLRDEGTCSKEREEEEAVCNEEGEKPGDVCFVERDGGGICIGEWSESCECVLSNPDCSEGAPEDEDRDDEGSSEDEPDRSEL